MLFPYTFNILAYFSSFPSQIIHLKNVDTVKPLNSGPPEQGPTPE